MVKDFTTGRDGVERVSSCAPPALMTPPGGEAELQQECPGEPLLAPPGSLRGRVLPPSTAPLSTHSRPLRLQWFLLAARWEASNAEETSRRNLSFSYEQFPGLWQNCPPDPTRLSRALIISLWRCPAPGRQVQTGRSSSSTHQDAEFSRCLRHPRVLFRLRTPHSGSNNQLSDWVFYWL